MQPKQNVAAHRHPGRTDSAAEVLRAPAETLNTAKPAASTAGKKCQPGTAAKRFGQAALRRSASVEYPESALCRSGSTTLWSRPEPHFTSKAFTTSTTPAPAS